MKLNYLKSYSETKRPIVLENRTRHIELFVRQDSPDSFTLFTFAGKPQGQPEKHKQLGPFQTEDQAIAARNAILHELIQSGYEILEKSPAVWALMNQQQLNELRRTKTQSKIDYRLNPSDVFLDW